MNAKTMEGIVGSKNNVDLTNTPMRVFKEARRKGDVATMERAMGYAGEFTEKADEYKVRAHEGTKEDVKEARKKAEAEQENAIRKRKEEREELEKRIEESRNKGADTVEISEEGKVLQKESTDSAGAEQTGGRVTDAGADAAKPEPVIYTKTGETGQPETGTEFSVSV